MKPRTAQTNALVSIIPFFGYSSFVYLGKKLGLMAYGTHLLVSVCFSFTGVILGKIIFGNVNVADVLLFVLPATFISQMFIIYKFTLKKNALQNTDGFEGDVYKK